MSLGGKHIVLGLSGGIACYKAAEFTRAMIKAGATVQVVMTEAAQRFITPVTMQALSNRPVFTSQWDARQPNSMAHIDLSREADAIVIAPASADFIAKLAQGRADELLSLLCLARPIARCPLLVAPAMNREMWAHPATQRNLQQLQLDGAQLLGPNNGDQACGETGDGRMLEPAELLAELTAFFQPKLLLGQRVLITAGPTFEPIDPVRGLTNRSSGKMGFAIARAAAEAGAEVMLVAGPVHLATPRGVRRIDVGTAQQMREAVMAVAARQQVFIATAAVADWRPASVAAQKIKKTAEASVPTLALTENPDILAEVARLPAAPFCIGFAAESGDLLAHARTKLAKKGVALIVANLGPATFGADDNELTLVDAQGEHPWPRADKLALARRLVAEIAARLPSSRSTPTPRSRRVTTRNFAERIALMNAMYKLPAHAAPTVTADTAERLTKFKATLLDEVSEIDAIITAANNGAAPLALAVDLADLLGDIIVYCRSEALKYGLPLEQVLDIIMDSNESKLGADGEPIYDGNGKFLKGPNYWKPEPKIRALLERMKP